MIASAIGHIIFQKFFSRRLDIALAQTLNLTPAPLPAWFVAIPAAFIIGVLLLTWITYLIAYAFADQEQPLVAGNLVSMTGATLFLSAYLGAIFQKKHNFPFSVYLAWLARNRLELLFVALAASLATWMMRYTLNIQDDHTLSVGISVFSDFGPHLAVIRSFSEGHNFPTQYPHFPDGTARYHFMFQFLAGNLEFLGLPLDWALNLPSILSFVACLMLLYALAVNLIGNKNVGLLTAFLFFFRSSPAWWQFVTATEPVSSVFEKIWLNENFIGSTLHEDWGLWNQNVYLNQRHLPLGLAMLFLVLILLFPLFRNMVTALSSDQIGPRQSWWRLYAFSSKSWLPESAKSAAMLGLLLGLFGFWNGAVVITALLLMLFMTAFSRHRLEYLIIAVISLLIALLENQLFIGIGKVAVKTELVIGFLAEQPANAESIIHYYFSLLGVLPVVLCASFIQIKLQKLLPMIVTLGFHGKPRGGVWLLWIFLSPIVLATSVKFTPDIAINHKYVMISVMLLNILIASILVDLWNKKAMLSKALSMLLVFLLTATGIMDLITIINRDRDATALKVQLDHPILAWIEKNTNPRDILLTDWYSLHTILLSGRKIFYGWPYYAWGAGYDTETRSKIVNAIYGGTDPDNIKELVTNSGIDYIVIDSGNRQSEQYQLNEELLLNLYPLAVQEGDITILKCKN